MSKEQKNLKIEYFYFKNRFFDLFFSTKKYLDLLWSKEAFWSLIISIALNGLMIYLISVNKPVQDINPIIPIVQALFPILLGGLFSLLGLIIGGLALITGTISEKVIYKINKDNQIEVLMSIIFNFYFSGAITGLALIVSLFCYIISYLQKPFEWALFLPISLIVTYLIIFSVIYSVMLLGTCIRILLLRYNILTKSDTDTEDASDKG